MRKLTIEEIQKFSGRKGVTTIAVENFLGTMGESDAREAFGNLRNDARSYKWNAATQKAISDGILMADKKTA